MLPILLLLGSEISYQRVVPLRQGLKICRFAFMVLFGRITGCGVDVNKTTRMTHIDGLRRKTFRQFGGFAVLHQCIRPLIGAYCARGHRGYQRACVLIKGTGLRRAKWVTRLRRRREDRSAISFHPLADLGSETALRQRSLLIVQFLCSCREATVKAGCRIWSASLLQIAK
jgi:hypothetical protein